MQHRTATTFRRASLSRKDSASRYPEEGSMMHLHLNWSVRLSCFALATALATAGPAAQAQIDEVPRISAAGDVRIHQGMCEPSAAVGLAESGRRVLLAASDEDNILRAYFADGSGTPPLTGGDVGARLNPTDMDKGVDIEAAAQVGNRIYWIASHGRDKDGDPRPERRRFFAIEANQTTNGIALTMLPGRVDVDLISALRRLGDPTLNAAIGQPHQDTETISNLAPEDGGLNIEGLARGREDEALFIGLRNPRHDNRALVVPFRNPAAALEGQAPDLGRPIPLNLGGRGVRSIEYIERNSSYLIVAGPHDTGADFTLYSWSGRDGADAEEVEGAAAVIERLGAQQDSDPGRAPFRFGPEAMIVGSDGRTVQLLSDDGDRRVDGRRCQAKATQPSRRSFRSITLDLVWQARPR
jgi:hypothetical protein